MAKNAATEETLGALHSKLAKVLGGVLDVYDKAQQEYLEADDPDAIMPEPSAPILSVALKLLSDSKITCVPSENKEAGSLAEKLANRRSKLKAVSHDEPDNVVAFGK